MNVAIVGSRNFPQLKLVEWYVRDMPEGVTVVSGGASGVDQAAADAAEERGLAVAVELPDLTDCTARHEFTKRYHARNQRIVDRADLVVAFTEKDSGGTWDTIKRARKAGKPVKIIRPSAFFPGDSDPEQLGIESVITTPETQSSTESTATAEPAPKIKGSGPFQIRRASLGSYALRRKLYISPEEWADIVVEKDDHPEALADRIAPAMIAFFEKHHRLGCVHAVTTPPRSIRNLDKTHPMEIVAARIGEALGCDHPQLFEPWEKSKRGRHAKVGVVEVRPEIRDYVGRVVWVLDDVYTTGRTLSAAVQALISLEIHAHGLAYVYIA